MTVAITTPGSDGRALARRTRLRFSLAAKTAILVMLLVTVTTATLAGALYTIAQKTFVDREAKHLAESLPKDAAILASGMEALRGDAYFLATVAEVRQLAGDVGAAELVDATETELQDALARRFADFVRIRPHYVDVRLVVADRSRELVRVNRIPTGTVRVQNAALQVQSGQSYYRGASALPAGAVFVSEIETESAAAVAGGAGGATIRAATPIYRGAGTLYGMIVITVDVQSWVAEVSRLTSTDRSVFLLNGPADYIYMFQTAQLYELEPGTGTAIRDQYPALAGIVDGTERRVSAVTETHVIHAERIDTNPADPTRYLTLAAATPMELVLSGSESMRNWTAVVAVVMMLLAGGTALLVARRVGRPLREMAEAASEIAGGDLDAKVEERRATDELADLGRAINDMTGRLSSTLVSRDALAAEVGDRRRAEAELARARDSLALKAQQLETKANELESANHELEAFSYSVSHDLRAPLRSIDGFSLALSEDYSDRLDDGGRDMVRRVRQATTRMGMLIDDLLKLSRVSRFTFDIAEVDLSKAAEEVIRRLREAEPARDVEVTIAPGVTAQADSRLMAIVLANLIENAWKYSARTERAVIEFGPVEASGRKGFFVRDNGVGFDMAYADKLFQPFQRLHGAAEFSGTGIGLVTVARIVRRHGGTIRAEAAPGKGATFTVTL